MEIKFYSFEGGIDYPVAEHISDNLVTINNMAIKLSKLYSKKIRINLWCRGSSGAIIAAIIASKLIKKQYNTTICHVKKDGEENHHGSYIYYISDGINIIVDDFICSGKTINIISKVIKEKELNFDCLLVTENVPLYTLIRIPSIIISDSLQLYKGNVESKITKNQTFTI